MSGYLYEITLLLALVFVLARRPPRRSTDVAGSIVLGLTTVFLVFGVATGNPTNPAINDARGLIIVGIATIVSGRVFGYPEAMKTVRVLKWSLWFSATMVVLGQFGVELHGASEDAGLSFAGAGERALSGAERFLTSATHASLATVCISLALVITHRARLRTVAPWLIPGLIVVFFSFSRNSILAVGVAVIYAIVASRLFRSAMTALVALVFGGVAAGVMYGFAIASSSEGPLGWLAVQINAYVARVVDGISPAVISVDTSAQYRNRESELLLSSWMQSPIQGHGMGEAYRVPVGSPDSFTATSGIYYGHNFYLWLGVKAGIVGLAVILLVFLVPLMRRMTDAPTPVVGASAALAGLLVASYVAPFPLGVESGASMLIGILLGTVTRWPREHASQSLRSKSVRPLPIHAS
ncbi:O-antigen ligase family protein [Agromyces protaetiae]|nr:O-antigen ligase family protein [Agromyces protaetiae]